MPKSKKKGRAAPVSSAGSGGGGGDVSGKVLAALLHVEKVVGAHSAWASEPLRQMRLLHKALKMLDTAQEPYAIPEPCEAPFTTRLSTFMSWFQSCIPGADDFPIAPTLVPGKGVGVVATRPIPRGEAFIEVLTPMLLSTNSAVLSELGGVIMGSQLLRDHPEHTLAIHLLLEKYRGRGVALGPTPDGYTTAPDGSSFYAPYIDTLPPTCTNLLYFTMADFEALEAAGSAVYTRALHLFRTNVKMYCLLFREVAIPNQAAWPGVTSAMSWRAFRWALAMVMSRQNKLPAHMGMEDMLALVPLWDMINHEPGENMTRFDTEKGLLQCNSNREFGEGEEVTMYYGSRSNTGLFLFAGFTVDSNANDTRPITIQFMTDDPLFKLRALILKNCNVRPATRVDPSGSSADTPGLYQAELTAAGKPTPVLTTLLRVLSATKDDLGAILRRGRINAVDHVSDENDQAAALHLKLLVKAEAGEGPPPAVPVAEAPAAGDGDTPVLRPTSHWVASFLAGEAALLQRCLAWTAGVMAGEHPVDDPECPPSRLRPNIARGARAEEIDAQATAEKEAEEARKAAAAAAAASGEGEEGEEGGVEEGKADSGAAGAGVVPATTPQ